MKGERRFFNKASLQKEKDANKELKIKIGKDSDRAEAFKKDVDRLRKDRNKYKDLVGVLDKEKAKMKKENDEAEVSILKMKKELQQVTLLKEELENEKEVARRDLEAREKRFKQATDDFESKLTDLSIRRSQLVVEEDSANLLIDSTNTVSENVRRVEESEDLFGSDELLDNSKSRKVEENTDVDESYEGSEVSVNKENSGSDSDESD